jgi:rubrerythrin
MIEERPAARDEEPGVAIAFRTAGERAKGEFRCVGCGYGVAIATELPTCPMCGGASWQAARWRPFSRALGRPS